MRPLDVPCLRQAHPHESCRCEVSRSDRRCR